jgi:peptide/nickel transport system permease protein
MSRYIVRRLLQMIPLLVGITLLTFGIVNLVPGSPISGLRGEMRGNRQMRQRDIERIERQLGLDRPLAVRYVVWVGNLARGDLGISLRNYAPVTRLIRARLPNTLLLTTSAFLLSFLAGEVLSAYGWFGLLS